MRILLLIVFSLIISYSAYSQEDKADINDEYWSFGTRDVAEFNNPDMLSENIQYRVKITYLPIEAKIDGRGKYVNDKKDSIWNGFYNNGKPYFTEWYNKGKLKNGMSYDASGKTYIYKKEIQFAKPIIGWDDFIFFAQRYWMKVADFIEAKYPDNYQFLKNKEIAVSFEIIVKENGTIDIGEIANGRNYGFDKAAARKMLSVYNGKWMAALLKGQAVESKVKYTVFVKF
ncbi:MAG: hypothetical protein NTZ33_05465 [Bacteroidetes bacterium]|nr:hypothetical protein [Bacteroidota bacterium]